MTIKKIFGALCLLLSTVAVLNSCTAEEQEFDRNKLIGKWASGTLFNRYDANGKGATWDTSDDVNEDDAQIFEWTLVKATLTEIHIMEMGPGIPKIYTVTLLTDTELSYKDDHGKVYNFKKK